MLGPASPVGLFAFGWLVKHEMPLAIEIDSNQYLCGTQHRYGYAHSSYCVWSVLA